MTSKTANSVIRYLPERTVGVLDRQQAGKTVQDVLGFGGSIPVVGSMREGLALRADRGADRHRAAGRAACRTSGAPGWPRRSITAATSGAGCTPSSATIRCWPQKAAAGGRKIFDLRRPPADLPIASGLAKTVDPLRRAHGRDRLQRRQDDGAAPAHPAAQRAGRAHPVRGDGPDRHHDRGLGDRGGRGGGRLHRRRGGAAGAGGREGRGRRAGRRAGQHQPSRLFRRDPRACCTAPVPMR